MEIEAGIVAETDISEIEFVADEDIEIIAPDATDTHKGDAHNLRPSPKRKKHRKSHQDDGAA